MVSIMHRKKYPANHTCACKSLDGSVEPKHGQKREKKTVPPNPEYKQAGGGGEAVKTERATKVEVRWERKAAEQGKIRGMKGGGRRPELVPEWENHISQSGH